MTDRNFLIWLHQRLVHEHCESELVDYMHKLRDVIRATPREQESQNVAVYSSIEDLEKDLRKIDKFNTAKT